MSRTETTLTVYIRSYCHLCEAMLSELEIHRVALGFELKVVDIEDDETLETLYGEKIPVLKAGEHELCHYFLDKSVLYEYIEGGEKAL